MVKNTDKEKDFYLTTRVEAKREIEKIDETIDRELQRVKERVTLLKEKKMWVRQIYDGATEILGTKNEFVAADSKDKIG